MIFKLKIIAATVHSTMKDPYFGFYWVLIGKLSREAAKKLESACVL